MTDQEFTKVVVEAKEASLLDLEDMVYQLEKKLQTVEAKFEQLKSLMPYIITCRGSRRLVEEE